MPFHVGMRVLAKATAFDARTGPKWSEQKFGHEAATATIAGKIVSSSSAGKWQVHWDIDNTTLEMSEKEIWPDPSRVAPDVLSVDNTPETGLNWLILKLKSSVTSCSDQCGLCV